MIRIGCRAHDYGKHTPVQLAHILHTAGYTGAQLAMPRAIEGIEDLHRSQMHSFPQFFRHLMPRISKSPY